MNIKKLLSLAVITTLPFNALAAYTYTFINTPANVQHNGTATITSRAGPYQIATIEDDDDEHIASTAYVKGAYNDLIATTNYLVETDSQKQMRLLVPTDDDEIYIDEYVLDSLDDASNDTLATSLATKNAIDAQRVEVYTNWDDDTDKTEVAFVVASAQE